jgi:hypothetical protein
MMMAAMMAPSMGCTALAQTRHAGVGDDEADDSWDIVGGGIGKPISICLYTCSLYFCLRILGSSILSFPRIIKI